MNLSVLTASLEEYFLNTANMIVCAQRYDFIILLFTFNCNEFLTIIGIVPADILQRNRQVYRLVLHVITCAIKRKKQEKILHFLNSTHSHYEGATNNVSSTLMCLLIIVIMWLVFHFRV